MSHNTSHNSSAGSSSTDLSKPPVPVLMAPAPAHTPVTAPDVDQEKSMFDTNAPSVHGSSKDEQDNQPESESEYPTAFALAMIVVALILAVFMAALDMTIVATASEFSSSLQRRSKVPGEGVDSSLDAVHRHTAFERESDTSPSVGSTAPTKTDTSSD